MIESDEQIMERVARGEQAAFAVFCGRYSPRLFGLLVKLLGFGADAEDTLQDVLFEIWRRAAQYRPEAGSVETWALMLARSRAIDRLRSRRSERARMNAVAGEANPRAESVPPVSTDLQSVIGCLSDDQRSVLSLAYQHGLSREQIADTLDIPVGTVKTRLRAAVRTLGDALTRKEGAQP